VCSRLRIPPDSHGTASAHADGGCAVGRDRRRHRRPPPAPHRPRAKAARDVSDHVPGRDHMGAPTTVW
jgi:hypothetical protein